MTSSGKERNLWAAASVTMALVLLVVVALNVVKFSTTNVLTDDAGNEASGGNASSNPPAGPDSVPVSAQDLLISVDEQGILVAGTAPDPGASERMTALVAELYGGTAEFASTAVAEAGWIDSYSDVLLKLGLFSEATLEITQNETKLTGKVSRSEFADNLERTLSTKNGFPPLVNEVEVTDEPEAGLNVTVNQFQVTVSGDVPSQAIKQDLLSSIEDGYGQVIDLVSVDDSVVSQLNLLRFSDDVAALAAFDSFTISFIEGNSFAVITGGVEFLPGESALTEASEVDLATLPDYWKLRGLRLRVIGRSEKTDDETGTGLSVDRARTVADQLEGELAEERPAIVIREGVEVDDDRPLLPERTIDIEIGVAFS